MRCAASSISAGGVRAGRGLRQKADTRVAAKAGGRGMRAGAA